MPRAERIEPRGDAEARARPQRRASLIAAVAAIVMLGSPAGSSAAPNPGDYRQHDFGGGNVFNIVPPGQNGFTNAAQAAGFLTAGNRPPHQFDQQNMYANLVYRAPNLKRSQVTDFFKDASFGVKPGDVARTYTPNCSVVTPPSADSGHCGDVTIVRDKGFGIPHVYGQDRAGLMFGLGYVTAEDRLFLADLLRHAGRAELSSFIGGSQVGQDRETWESAPYANDGELQIQYDRADELYGALGRLVQEDVQNYVDGVNQYIAEARLDPLAKQDALYTAIGRPQGPDPWKVTDILAAGSLVAGIFGKGGGGEVGAATSLQAAIERFGKRGGRRVWSDFRSADDPEAPSTVRQKRFGYRTPPKKRARGKAMPDPGSVERVDVVASGSGASATRGSAAGGEGPTLDDVLEPLRDLDGGSNALLVSGRESKGGRPVAVFGPQTGYFAPQLLMEQDAHAPASDEGPAIHARGVSFVGTNLYVQLGRGVDYAWSATSAGQDITDTFAVPLCEPDGSAPTKQSMHYRWRGQCLPIEVLERTNSWTPNAADMTPPGSETLRAYRTKAGLISHRALRNGKPIAYTKLRATYFHEADAAGAFANWNSPQRTKSAKDFFHSGMLNDLTFNWFYVDDEEIAYFNSGANPKRAPRTHPNFPVVGRPKFMWRGFDEDLVTFEREPLRKHPRTVAQRFLTSWNNKQARGYRCDTIRCFSSIYRVGPLDDRIREGIKGGRRMSLVKLINAMEDAGTVDLRGDAVVPWALRVIKRGRGIKGARLQAAVGELRRWARRGAHRRDRDRDGAYDDAEAVKIIDAWWPLWVKRQFRSTLGEELHDAFIGSGGAIHDAPGPIGSAFSNVVYGFVHKDLRSLLGRKVRGRYSRVYCGKGKLRRCQKMLRKTLREAAATSFEELYGSEGCTLTNGVEASPQMCHDAVDSTDVTVAAVGPFHWINRPTFQQAIRFPDGR